MIWCSIKIKQLFWKYCVPNPPKSKSHVKWYHFKIYYKDLLHYFELLTVGVPRMCLTFSNIPKREWKFNDLCKNINLVVMVFTVGFQKYNSCCHDGTKNIRTICINILCNHWSTSFAWVGQRVDINLGILLTLRPTQRGGTGNLVRRHLMKTEPI